MADEFRPDAALLPLMPPDMRAAFGDNPAEILRPMARAVIPPALRADDFEDRFDAAAAYCAEMVPVDDLVEIDANALAEHGAREAVTAERIELENQTRVLGGPVRLANWMGKDDG